MKRRESTHVAALIDIKQEQYVEVSDNVVDLLEEWHYEFPKELLSRRAIDHKIELKLGTQPLAKAPYRMAPSELTEFLVG